MEYTTLNHTVWEDLKNRIVDLHCFEYTGEGVVTEVEANRIIMAAREHWFKDEQ